jgi:hypothetical protein
MSSTVFHRLALAKSMGRRILTTSTGSAAPSGLFLAAPRRTGKSTFLREDLAPVLEDLQAYVLYVDLWADKKTDPGDAIVGVVRAALSKFDGIITRLARSAGMEKVNVGGIAFSLDRVGLGGNVSLSAAMAALSDEIKHPIVLIIDEAQHAITTDKGYDALYALKAARDELNSSAHHGLRIVATGSNRDKLAMLRNSRDQAFFGAPLVAFPPLGKDYVRWFCEGIGLPGPLDPDEVEKLFERAGRRPEILGAAADALRYDFELSDADVPSRFSSAVEDQIQAGDAQTMRVIHALTPIQSAIFYVLAAHGEDYSPFEDATMDAYRQVLANLAPHQKSKLEVSNVQQALVALQEKSLVWREKRGVYALEEVGTADLLKASGLLSHVPLKSKLTKSPSSQ